MSPLSDDRADLEPGEAIRACVGELGKLHPDYERAQVYATLSLRDAVLKLAAQLGQGAKDDPADPEARTIHQSEGLRQVQAYLDQADGGGPTPSA